jgi:hypothetical protein
MYCMEGNAAWHLDLVEQCRSMSKNGGLDLVFACNLNHSRRNNRTMLLRFHGNVGMLTVSVDVLNGDTGHDSIQVG